MNALFPLFAVLIWSINAIVSKVSAGAIEPSAIAFYRWFLALIVLSPFILPGVIRNRRAIYSYWWQLLILGMLGMVLFQSSVYYAAHMVDALFIGIINAVVPLLTVLISLWLLRLVPTWGILVGSLLSFYGLALLVSGGQPQQLLTHGIGSGELILLGGAAAYALYGVLMKRWNIQLPHWQMLYMQVLFGTLLILPGFLLTPDVALNAGNIPLVLFAGIFSSIFAPILWIQGVARMGANKASIFMNLTPVFTAIIAVSFLHEQFHAYHLIGGGLTLIGVIVAQRLRMPLMRRKAH